MNKTPNDRRALILKCLTDGMSLRATCRVTGASMGTLLRLLEEVGTFTATYADYAIRKLKTVRVEVDEQHSWVGAKQRHATAPHQGDLWLYASVDSESKLVINYLVGARTPDNAVLFVRDLAERLVERVQLTSDGHQMYLHAVRVAFDFVRCDFARLVKTYGTFPDTGAPGRYTAPVCTGAIKERVIGRPDMALVSTSYIERVNLTTRQNCRRFTRLTNAFSKKVQNHIHAVALHFFTYNFIRPHGTLTKAAGGIKTTPAMAAGLTDRVWTLEDMLQMMDPKACRIGAAKSVTVK